MITVLIILAYLVIGSLMVAVMRWADRNCVNEAPWFDKHADNFEIGMVVLLWPLFLALFLIFVALIKLPSLFYKGLMILLTTIVYVIKALAGKGDSDGSTDNSADNY